MRRTYLLTGGVASPFVAAAVLAMREKGINVEALSPAEAEHLAIEHAPDGFPIYVPPIGFGEVEVPTTVKRSASRFNRAAPPAIP